MTIKLLNILETLTYFIKNKIKILFSLINIEKALTLKLKVSFIMHNLMNLFNERILYFQINPTYFT